MYDSICRTVTYESEAGRMATSMTEPPKSLDELVRPHVDSFDYFIGEGLQTVVDLLEPIEVEHSCRWSAGTIVPAVVCWADTCPGPFHMQSTLPSMQVTNMAANASACSCRLSSLGQTDGTGCGLRVLVWHGPSRRMRWGWLTNGCSPETAAKRFVHPVPSLLLRVCLF